MALDLTDRKYYNPLEFCLAFKDVEGNHINIHEQMDVDEFYNMLMDRVENCVKGNGQPNFIQACFGGSMKNRIISSECAHMSESEEPFLALNMQVRNKKSLFESLETLTKEETLEGQNRYLCSFCNKKVVAQKHSYLNKIPDHLIFVLKRFQFDLLQMKKIKVNDYYAFPSQLNLENYSDAKFIRENSALLQERDQTSNITRTQPQFQDGYYDFVLSGIVIHRGSSDFGHYYSYVTNRKAPHNKPAWYAFDDKNVEELDPRTIYDEAFGGRVRVSQNEFSDKLYNAYLLFYDRVVKERPEVPGSLGDSIDELLKNQGAPV